MERAERFPSVKILRKIAKPLGFDEDELFMLAGFLFYKSDIIAENEPLHSDRQLDPHVAAVLSQEPVEVQWFVLGILSIVKSFAKSIREE